MDTAISFGLKFKLVRTILKLGCECDVTFLDISGVFQGKDNQNGA